MGKIGIFFNENAVQEIMSSSKMESMEQEIMMQKKSEIEAAFLNEFGVPASFRISIIRSGNKTWHGRRFAGRVIFRVLPDDKRTRAILRQHPGWLGKFL